MSTKSKKVESNYQINVLNVNKRLKDVQKSFGGCIRFLLSNQKEANLPSYMVKVLSAAQKDRAVYASLKKNTRTTKYKGKDLGTYSPFYLLQTLHKAYENEQKAVDQAAKAAAKEQGKATARVSRRGARPKKVAAKKELEPTAA